MYVRLLSGISLVNSESPVPEPVTSRRIELLAFRLMLAHALDVEGYRAHWPIIRDETSDEAVLVELHRLRANTAIIPAIARSESREWLRVRGHQVDAQRV